MRGDVFEFSRRQSPVTLDNGPIDQPPARCLRDGLDAGSYRGGTTLEQPFSHKIIERRE